MHHSATRLLVFAMIVLGARAPLAALSDSERNPAPNTLWTVDDMIAPESGDQFRISPDDKWAVWVKHAPDKEKGAMISNLILSSLTEKLEIQLTRGPNHDTKPQWSGDGRMVAFLTDRPHTKKEVDSSEVEPKSQVWLLNAQGGEPWPLTTLERGVKDFGWIDDKTILIAAEDGLTLYEQRLKERKDDGEAVEDPRQSPPVRLFKVDVKSGEINRLTANDDWIESVSVSPDGRHAAIIEQRSLSYEFDEKVRPVIVLYDLATGMGRPISAEEEIFPWFSEFTPQVRWTGDSSGFYFISHYSTHPVYRQAFVEQLFFYEVAQGKAVKIDLGWEAGLGLEVDPAFAVIPDGFVALLAAGARYKPARYIRQGSSWKREWVEGDDVANIFGLESSRNGRTVVYRNSTASRPEQWIRATLDGASMRNRAPVTDLNPAFRGKTPARSEIVRWKGALDEEVEGILFYPQGFEIGKRYPLIVMIHGGPLSMDLDGWDDRTSRPVNLYTQRGAFVLAPNYHGGGNYGLKWAESIGGGKYYELEVPDIEKGVDSLIARGLVDSERLGAMGWSNGAILAAALTVSSTRFKAASCGAGNVEQASDWSYTTFGAAFAKYYFGAAPIDDPQLYIRKSPMYDFKKVRTPTIIFSGSEDRAVGHAQGWMHFRTLQQLGQTDVRFIVFPGEGHGLKKLAHRRRKMEEEFAWFEKYLFQSALPTNDALKHDSPLAQELKRQNAKRTGTHYGIVVKSALVPEMVSYQGMKLGRFEVTRAQYAAFDKNYKIEPGTENFPANGISFSNAQAYCAWLSKLTGESYRLGSAEDLNSIYESARWNENTLDFWAGYSPNPDDTARLHEKLKELPRVAPLLKEVGSFRGRGEVELVFDLGGNVSEWAVDKSGAGKPLGGSADQPADSTAPGPSPAPAYIGLRVIRGK